MNLPQAPHPIHLKRNFQLRPNGVRGKFIYHQDQKVYFKAIRLQSADVDVKLLRESNFNTIWLEDLSEQAIEYFLAHDFFVIFDLGFEKVLQKRIAGDGDAEKKWIQNVGQILERHGNHAKVVGLDLGAGHSAAIQKWLGESAWLRSIRKALGATKKLAGEKLVTNTFAIYRVGRQNKFGHSLKTIDLGKTYHQLLNMPVDFASFEIADEAMADFRGSLACAQIIASDLPMVAHARLPESAQVGLSQQAEIIDTQIRLSFNAACSGITLTNWRDHNASNGFIDIHGRIKPSLPAASRAFSETPFGPVQLWPTVSVIICAFNSAETLDDCLAGCAALNYHDVEVIVVVDKSRDDSEEIAKRWANRLGYKVIVPEKNSGLSYARNVGAKHATGEILAYLDADAYPDPDWLRYLSMAFLQTKHAIIGGPNLNPMHANDASDCIDKSPGNPGIVMLGSEACDHVAGCNLAIRREFFEAIGGFTDAYKGGGDDVTLCWRTIRYGGSLGFAPGAFVWHYRRWTVGMFLRQQRTYGKGEYALERDWPERFNSLGHQVAPDELPGWKRSQNSSIAGMYQAFSTSAGFLATLGRMPEFLFINALLAVLSLLTLIYREFAIFIPFALIGIASWLIPPITEAMRAPLRYPTIKNRLIVAFLFIAQPIARARGRWGDGMTPWRDRLSFLTWVNPRIEITEAQASDYQRTRQLEDIEATRAFKKLREELIPVNRGGELDDWHLQIEGGIFGGVRALVTPGSKWLTSFFVSRIAQTGFVASIALAVFALTVGAWPIAFAALGATAIIIAKTVKQTISARAHFARVVSELSQAPERSLWESFQPPRHFFVNLAPPVDRA